MRASLAARAQATEVPGWVPMRIVLAQLDLVGDDEVVVVAAGVAPEPAAVAVRKLAALPSEVRRAAPGLAPGNVLIIHVGGRHAILNLPRQTPPQVPHG